MPYASNADMPMGVRKGLSPKEQSQWRAIFNSCHAKHADNEAMCFKMANGTVKGRKEREESDGAEALGEIREVIAADGTKGYQYVDSFDYAARAYDQSEVNYNPVGGDSTKACSNCRFFISPARCAIVNGDIAPNGVSDMWDAVSDPMANMMPMDVRVVGFGSASIDGGGGDGEVLTEGEKMDRAKMPTSDFAYVDKEGGKHLPIHDAAHVRNALARFDQTQFESDSAKSAARTKILAAAKRLGVDASSKDNGLRPTDATAAEESLIARVTSRILEGIKSLLTPATPQGAVHAGGRVGGGASGTGFSLVRDQKSGRTRFMAVMTNNFVDHHGEVFTEAAHQEYVDWAEKSGEYPELWLWHTPGSRIGQADWLDYSNGFVVASGLVDQSKELVAEKLAQQEDVGVSHGFVCLKQKDGTIVKYRSYELSPLPIASAANEWTSFDLLGLKENEMPFNEKRREWLTKLVGEDTVKSWEKDTDNLSTTLKELGVEFKSKMEAAPAEAAGEAEGEKDAAAALAGEVRTLVGTVGALTTAVAGFKGELEAAKVESKKSREDILAEELKARTNPTAQNGFQASASKATVVEGAKAQENVAWFDSVVMGVKSGADGVGAAAQ